MNLNKIAELLKSDPSVDASTVVIDTRENQVEFYTKGDPEDYDCPQPSMSTQEAIEKLGGDMYMNDCEGCYNEGVVWPKE